MTSSTSTGLAILAGLLTGLSPCVLPILPIVVGRSLQAHRFGPVALVFGLISGFAVAGSLLGLTASWLTGLANAIRTGAIVLLLLLLGLLAIVPSWQERLFGQLFGQLFGRLFKQLPTHRWPVPQNQLGLLGEFCLGTQLGLLWTPCAGPGLASILLLAAVEHRIAHAFGLLLAYGTGAGLPLLIIAYGSRAFSRSLLCLRPRSLLLQRIGGIIVVTTAIAILQGWDLRLQLWLGHVLQLGVP